MNPVRIRTSVLTLLGLAACAALAAGQQGDRAADTPPPALPPEATTQGFPHLRIDAGARTVEMEAWVPLQFDLPRAPRVFLELIACTPDTREHEVLVATRAKPSHLHAALLAIGLRPGRPARWTQEEGRVIAHAPEGEAVSIEFIYTNPQGEQITATPSDWIVNARNDEPWPEGHFVFAGSLMAQRAGSERYLADIDGTVIGLASFGMEVIAWPRVINPDSQVDEPEWIGNVRTIPPMDTKVTVRIQPVERK